MISDLLMDSGQDYNDSINKFFKDNYDELFDIAKKDCVNTEFQPEDLLSDLLVYVIDNSEKIKELKQIENKDRPFTRWCAQWMYNNIRLFSANVGNSNFQSRFIGKKYADLNVDGIKSVEPCTNIQQITEGEDVWLVNNLSPEDASKLVKLEHIVTNQLSEVEKQLYNLVYVQKLSVPKIKKLIPDVSNYSFQKMISEFNVKIESIITESGQQQDKGLKNYDARRLKLKQAKNQRYYYKHQEKVKARVLKNYYKKKIQNG